MINPTHAPGYRFCGNRKCNSKVTIGQGDTTWFIASLGHVFEIGMSKDFCSVRCAEIFLKTLHVFSHPTPGALYERVCQQCNLSQVVLSSKHTFHPILGVEWQGQGKTMSVCCLDPCAIRGVSLLLGQLGASRLIQGHR